jgi:5-methylcytosine-specific restriction endonuclease McrA
MLRTRDGYATLCPACQPPIEPAWTGASRTKHRIAFLRAYGPPPACTRCGFVPEHPCQIDIDHIDGDHFNNTLSNLQPLCANCHRLKSLPRANLPR